jgi:hypothetical protein
MIQNQRNFMEVWVCFDPMGKQEGTSDGWETARLRTARPAALGEIDPKYCANPLLVVAQYLV